MARPLAAAFVLVLLVGAGPARASDVGLDGSQGHPRARFPLTVYAEPTGDPTLDTVIRRAVEDWNGVSMGAVGLRVFAWAEQEALAGVTIAVKEKSPRLMGMTYVDAGPEGVITLPVRIEVSEPEARGATLRDVVLYQVVAHELGHALGLAHVRDPRSIMCCVAGSIDFNDPPTREAYLAARRHPDLRSVEGQLKEHYARFWADH